MTYSEAMDRLVAGNKVTRASWGGELYPARWLQVRLDGDVMDCTPGRTVRYRPQPGDLEAGDWQEAGE